MRHVASRERLITYEWLGLHTWIFFMTHIWHACVLCHKCVMTNNWSHASCHSWVMCGVTHYQCVSWHKRRELITDRMRHVASRERLITYEWLGLHTWMSHTTHESVTWWRIVSYISRNTLQHTATNCNTLQLSATHCNTLQLSATHHRLQHTATHHRRIVWCI